MEKKYKHLILDIQEYKLLELESNGIIKLNSKPSFKKLFTFTDITKISNDNFSCLNQQLYSFHAFIYKNIFDVVIDENFVNENNFFAYFNKYKSNKGDYIFESFYKKYEKLNIEEFTKKNTSERNSIIQRFEKCIIRFKSMNNYIRWFKQALKNGKITTPKQVLIEVLEKSNNIDLITLFFMISNLDNYFISNVIQRLENKKLQYENTNKNFQIIELNYDEILQVKSLLNAQMFLNKVIDDKEINDVVNNKLKEFKILDKNENKSNFDVAKINSIWDSRYFVLGEIEDKYFELYFQELKNVSDILLKENSNLGVLGSLNAQLNLKYQDGDKYYDYSKTSSMFKAEDKKIKIARLRSYIDQYRQSIYYKNLIHFDLMKEHINILKDIDRSIFKLVTKFSQFQTLTGDETISKTSEITYTTIRNKLRHIEQKTILETWENKINLLRLLYSFNGARHIKNSVMKIIKTSFLRHGYDVEFEIIKKAVQVNNKEVEINHYFKLKDIKSVKDYNQIDVKSKVEIELCKKLFINKEK